MTITIDQDTLLLDRRAIAAYLDETLPELVAELGYAGIDTCVNEIETRARFTMEAWGVKTPRGSCYVCGSSVSPMGLCSCYDEVRTGRFHDVHDLKALKALPGHTVVERFACCSCGSLTRVYAQTAVHDHVSSGGYTARVECRHCAPPPPTAPRKPKAAKPPKGKPAALEPAQKPRMGRVDLLALAARHIPAASQA